jgi:hypothetical protein
MHYWFHYCLGIEMLWENSWRSADFTIYIFAKHFVWAKIHNYFGFFAQLNFYLIIWFKWTEPVSIRGCDFGLNP